MHHACLAASPIATVALLVSVVIAGCGEPGARGGDDSAYANAVREHLSEVHVRYEVAAARCGDLQKPDRCRRAVVRYRAELLTARRDLARLEAPAFARRADQTMRQALRLALDATARGLNAIDARDLGAWLEALGRHSRAGIKLNLAGAELLDALAAHR